MEKLYTVNKTRPGADCGSDHELLIAKFRLKLKKVEKTTRPFRCVYHSPERKEDASSPFPPHLHPSWVDHIITSP